MRKNEKKIAANNDFKLMIVDDDAGLIDSISSYLLHNGYAIKGYVNPLEGLEVLRREHYDLLILDYFMSPIKGDDFVAELRKFNSDLYVTLLTGHKDLAPPLATIKALDIQAYCEKSHRLDQLLLMIESGVKSISQVRRIKSYRDGLDGILAALPSMSKLKPFEDVVSEILTQLKALNGIVNAFILIGGFSDSDRVVYKGIGAYDVPAEDIGKAVSPEAMERMEQFKSNREPLSFEGGLILPINGMNESYCGAVYMERESGQSDDLLGVLLSQASALLQNVHLHERLVEAYSTLKNSYVETIEALRLAVDAKDVYTRGHSDRVSMYAQLIGAKLGLDKEELDDLRIGGLFHDIGKLGISDEILLKDGKLNDEEYMEIMKHPAKGAVILSAISAFDNIKHIVGCHHERIDGKGYPHGLTGDAIPFGAKIISVADSFDAMTSNRQYRRKLTQGAALEQLRLGRGAQFDSKIVDCFLSIVDENSDQLIRISAI